MPRLSPLDPSSFSRPDLAIVTSIKLSLSPDFEKKIFSGNVELNIKKVDTSVNEVILDTKDLDISGIHEIELNQPLKYYISEPDKIFGAKLTIDLPVKTVNNYVVKINYETKPIAAGIQWLEPDQTAGKKLRYVFSQFQPVHARTVIPCQDTPYVKTPYSATITTSKEFTVVMSAIREDKQDTKRTSVFTFIQKIPIPSYLIAFAIGALDHRKIGPRTTVWAEKEIIEEAAYEFAETENQLKTAEEICGPYVWGIYDLLVLPPSFPFGGMENPCLTFVTPTLLAGDRSLANVVAHEIAHSWTGNLVTNCNFEHFWLNEGFTVFVERKIIGQLTNTKEQDFQAYCGTTNLRETIELFGEENPLTSLVVDLENTHPDDAFSSVPYEKGHTFLRFLEDTVGGPADFEPFLRKYFKMYKFQSIDTNTFRSFFEKYFEDKIAIKEIDWNMWLHKPGMPPVIPKYDMTLTEVCNCYKNLWLNWDITQKESPFTKDDLNKLSTNQVIQLLQEILDSEPQPVEKLEQIEKIFVFDSSKNAEIKFRWLRIGLKAHWKNKIEPTLNWINKVGRMKYVRPLYRALYDWEETRDIAIKNFHENRHTMMHVSAYTVCNDLHIEN